MTNYRQGINDLETYCIANNRKELLEEWDYTKNNGLKPSDICYGTGKKIWWIGKCGHSYSASPNKRTKDNTGCPYCCNSHAKLLTGFNDLATTNPELVSSWDYEKNGQLLPTMVMKGQHIKVWWKGICGHSWQASVYHRVQGRGCPICRKESKTSFPEQAIFYYVQKCFPDAENSNISVLRGKELDIYIPSQKVGIEFDGSYWHSNKAKDENKNALCEKAGIRLFRIRDIQCPPLIPNPFVHIIDYNPQTDDSLIHALQILATKLGVSFDISLEQDRIDIYNRFIAQRKYQSLSRLYPHLSKEWNYDKNGNLTPELVNAMSNKKVWWKCENGHEWQSFIHARAKGSGCPYCNGNRLLKGLNDLETLYPDILKYWNYEKNEIRPDEVTSKSSIKVWWHCPVCGNDFTSIVANKVNHPNSCPYCTHRIPIVGKTDLNSVNPLLAKEWDIEKNNRLSPKDVTSSSDKKVWWRCELNHSFQSTIANRKAGKGCPYCSGHKVLLGFNDLAHQQPELVEEWNFEKNAFSPESVTTHSGKKAWWKCSKGHEWQATIDSRSNGVGCPYCKGTYRKAVLNKDTQVAYKSLKEAAASCGLKVGDTISLCCLGKLKTAGGYHWQYIDEKEHE